MREQWIWKEVQGSRNILEVKLTGFGNGLDWGWEGGERRVIQGGPPPGDLSVRGRSILGSSWCSPAH